MRGAGTCPDRHACGSDAGGDGERHGEPAGGGEAAPGTLVDLIGVQMK